MSTGGSRDATGLWMVPYADLMTILMILFLALFAYSFNNAAGMEKTLRKIEQVLASAESAEAAAINLRQAELASDVKDLMEGLALKDFGLRITAHYIHITLPSPVLFRFGSGRLSRSGAGVLLPLARLLADVPNAVIVKGHTDDRPIRRGEHRTNWELSAARAFSVIRYFSRQGLAPERFHARGYGEYRPAAPNDTVPGRRKNRRIEITIIREMRSK
ncbi:MAG: flagellar motor protein MotB [Elusimicrobiota bacterium]